MTSIGIDTGGTFTDFIWADADGRLHLHKQLSTPDDPSQAILDGLRDGSAPADGDIVHGSTVATNALLQRRGAKTALITTAGFADVLAIGRQNRPNLYALVPQKPLPLVPAERRYEVRERVGARGEIVIPLQEEDVKDVLARLAADPVESVAICLLFSFLHPEHEQRIGAALRAVAGDECHISLSCEVLLEYREFERTAATVINAYVAPLMGRYLSRLAERVAPRRLAVMQSNGGLIRAGEAAKLAARTVLSGPAGGVVGARHVAAGAGFEDIITFDMGGTSTDVALCPGRTPVTTEATIAGLPLRLPLIDIHTVGAGGGSLAFLDAGGALQVGPQSAGARPGPAGYHADYDVWRAALDGHFAPGLATVSDANLVLGRLDAEHFLGGQMRLYEAPARRAVAAMGERMGRTTAEAAWDVIRVANANMGRAIRHISVERGHDPRLFTLVAFGGGGPLHACELAAELGIPRVLAPLMPGVLSALGMLAGQPARDYSQTVMLATSDAKVADFLAAHFGRLARQARHDMAVEGRDPARLALGYGLDMRYVGQSHELTVDYWPGMSGEELVGRFHAAHLRRYGYAREHAATEIATLRLTVTAPAQVVELLTEAAGDPDARAAVVGEKAVWFDEGFTTARLYARDRLRAGHQFEGPAVVFQYDTTTIVPPGWRVNVDAQRNLLATHARH